MAGFLLPAWCIVCVHIDACGLRTCTECRPLGQGPHTRWWGGGCSAGTRASSPGCAPAPSGDKAPVLGILSGMRVGSAPVRRGTGQSVEPGRSPSPYSLHVIQWPVFLSLSVSPQLSLWLSILTVFCASFPSLTPHPPRTPPCALLGVCVSICVCLSCC